MARAARSSASGAPPSRAAMRARRRGRAAGRVAARCTAGLGAGVFELLWLSRCGRPNAATRPPRARRRWTTTSPWRSTRPCARGPVVLAASHTGNWELAAFGAAQAARRRTAGGSPWWSSRQSVGAFHAFCTHLRDGLRPRAHRPRGRVRGGARGAWPRGTCRDADRPGARPRQARRRRPVPRGARARRPRPRDARAGDRSDAARRRRVARRVAAQRAPAARASCRRHARGRMPTASAWITNATRESTRVLDAFVAQHPASWLWLHRRWRAPLEARRVSGRHRLSRPGFPANQRHMHGRRPRHRGTELPEPPHRRHREVQGRRGDRARDRRVGRRDRHRRPAPRRPRRPLERLADDARCSEEEAGRSCRTRRAATPPTTPCARSASRASSASRTS